MIRANPPLLKPDPPPVPAATTSTRSRSLPPVRRRKNSTLPRMKPTIAAALVIGACAYGVDYPKLEDYVIDDRLLDAALTVESTDFRFERVRAHSESDEVIFVVVTEISASGEMKRSGWLVASEESGLAVRFAGWKGTRLSWTSEADWGGHEGFIDVAQPDEGFQIPLSWDN